MRSSILASLLFFAVPLFTQAAVEKAKVLVQEIKPMDDIRRLLVPAKVEGKVNSQVTAEVEGFVTKIRRPLGSTVKAGEVILYVQNKDPSFTYAAVPVRAPISGVISQLNVNLMTRVARADKLFSVIDPKALKVSAEIPEADLAMLAPGSKGMFKRDLNDKEGLALIVSGISPLVDSRTGTAGAELSFTALKDLPSIGSVGHAIFEINKGKVLLIPESALGYSDGKPTVKIIDAKGNVRKKNIEIGEQKESQLVVKSGLQTGEQLIVRANRTVKEGEAVQVDEAAKN